MPDPSFTSTAGSINTLWLIAAALTVAGFIVLPVGLVALAHRRPVRFLVWALAGLMLVAFGALFAGLAVGLRGYAALVREDLVALVSVHPTAAQRFTATFRFTDGRSLTYELAGDEIQVDAHILKWKPIANAIGLHTLWSLDRVGGRYRAIDQERGAARTLYPLSAAPIVDLVSLRRRFALLEPLYDAEYGSATFVPADQPALLELRVSTSGLLLRPLR